VDRRRCRTAPARAGHPDLGHRRGGLRDRPRAHGPACRAGHICILRRRTLIRSD
jgi:hypothetical protein